jgi:DNA repair protein RecN (Recombination protein N)
MLQSLSIKNYALIDDLNVTFSDGFSIITGETGAGKSILLGALSIVLGKRADLSTLKSKEEKCIVEAEFLITKFELQSFFEENDLDFEERTIIRREILPNGKSRAFINDTPTTLNVLTELSEHLIDVHSQHQTLELADVEYQFLIIDALADTKKFIESYKKGLLVRKNLLNDLQQLLESQKEAQKQYDYNSHLLNELTEASFKEDEQEFLEETLDKLNHVEEIKNLLVEAQQIADSEEIGLSDMLNKYTAIASKLSSYGKEYESLFERMQSLKIEFEDIHNEVEKTSDSLEYSPSEIEKYNNRLQLLYNLQKKHQVSSIKELQEKQQILNEKVAVVDNATEIINTKKEEIKEVESKLNKLADTIHSNRSNVIPELIKKLENTLKLLEMAHTSFRISVTKKADFFTNGKDELEFLISTNKGSSFESIKKIASGGEMSRIMLAVKSILSNYSDLPTIIFDEIDTGVSGEVSNRIASVMETMSKNMQVIAITHLPQIAAKGQHHYKVFKTSIDNTIKTDIKQLSATERIEEVAEMLSGKNISESALVHAKQLLGQ